MAHQTSSKTPGVAWYLGIIVLILLGTALLRACQNETIFPEDSISYPPPGSLGCKGWDWRHPYLSALAYAPDASDANQTRLAVFAYNNLAFYDLAENKFTRCLNAPEDVLLKLSANGQNLAVSAFAGDIEIRQVSTNTRLANLSTEQTKVTELAFSPNGRYLAYLVKGSLRLWDATYPGQPPRELASGSPYRPVAFSDDGQTLALAEYEKIAQWNTWDWSEKPALPAPAALSASPATGLRYLPNGKSLLLWNGQGFAVLDATDGREIYHWIEYTGPQEYIYHLAVSPDGRYLAVMGHTYWQGSNTKTGSRLPGSNSFLNLWRTENWQYLGQLSGDGSALAFSPDSRTLAVNWEGKIRFMPLDELIPRLEMPEE